MNPYRIESLHLTQVGPFKELELVLPATPENGKAEVHILTGENGTGKTSILEAIASAFMRVYAAVPATHEHFLPAKIHIDGKVSIYFSYSQLIYYDNFRSLGIEGFELPKNSKFNYYHRFATFAYSGYRHADVEIVNGVLEINDSPFHNAASLTKSINSKIFLQWLINTQARELIFKGKNDLKKANQQRKSLEIIEQAITSITGLATFFELEDSPFQAKINFDGKSLNFDQIPDGLKSIVSWLGDLLMRMDRIQWADDIPVLERSFLLLLDEIDVHLHPAWQRKILPVVQQLFPNAQVIVSTHSPFVVGSVDGAWVHRFVKIDGFSALDGPPILSEDARSYEYILEEIFGIKEHFGIEIEKRLTEFQQLKKQLLQRSEMFDESRFRQLIDELRGQSTEIDSILGMELKQLQRLTQKSFIE